MAIFNEINKRSGLVVGTVVLALVLFLVSDAFFGQSSIFQGDQNKVGEIAGTDVDIQEYQQQLQEAEQNYMIQTNQPVSEQQRPVIQENAWNQLLFDIAYEEQFEELGLTVTEEEWLDMAKGDFIHPMVKQLFGNPENFNRQMVTNFLANLDQYPPQDQSLWYYVDTKLPEVRLREKYSNLFKKTNYITTAEAKRQYNAKNTKATAQYLNVPYFSVPDSAVQVTDAELRTYIQQNKANYQVEAGRTLDYVVFDVEPSAQDSARLAEEMEALATEFANVENDSLFVQYSSDQPRPVRYVRAGELPEDLQQKIGQIDTSKVYGPYLENNTYKLFKVLGTRQDTVFSAKASHILFKAEEGNEEQRAEAKQKAQEVLSQIKGGADFAQMAEEHGTDATATRGGDLGWFTEGQMVEPFEKAIFNSNRTGLLPNLVETQFGYHIIKIDEPRQKKQYKVAEVNQTMGYSEETKERVYQKAVSFANAINDTSDFYAKAEENPNLEVATAKSVGKNARRLNNLEAREVIRWAYNDGEVGDISPVMTLDDKFVVAALIDAREEGVAPLEDVREEVLTKVKQNKKAEQIISQLKEKSGSLKEIASAYGPSASTGKASDLTLSSNYMSGFGYDPVAVGRVFGLDENKTSAPFQGQGSVGMVELTKLNPAPEIADYASYKNELKQQREGRVDMLINEAIKEASEIEDQRYKFF